MGLATRIRRGRFSYLTALIPLLLAAGCDDASPATPDAATVDSGSDSGFDAASDVSDDLATAVDVPKQADVPPTPINYPMPTAGNAVPQSDPRWNGQYRFLYDAFGTEVLGDWPPLDFMLGLLRDEPAVFGNQFENFGFIPDPNDNLPIGLKRGLSDATLVHDTCAMCHVARLDDGTVWLGAPNTRLDIGRFRVEVSRRWVAAGHAPLLSELEATKALLLGPGRTNAESGDYPQVVPADFPPYYTLGQRTALNYMGTGHNVRSEAYLSIFSTGAGSPNPATARLPFPSEDHMDEFMSFFGTMAPPSSPAGDASLVARGRGVFGVAHCDSCHHVGDVSMDGVTTVDRGDAGRELLPGENAMYPRGTIRTSLLHRILQDGDGTMPSADAGADQGRNDLILFLVREHLSVGMTDGYRVNDLRGLAHTAPYLHNGSVATLEDLLLPAAQRARTFMRGTFLVDTSRIENYNGGHEFGTDLSADDRAALVAYLRSL